MVGKFAAASFALWLAVPQDPAPSTEPDEQVLGRVRAIEERIAALRERPFVRPVEAGEHDRVQLRAFLVEQFAKEMPPEKIAGWAKSLKAFRLIPPDMDLEKALLDFLTSQIAGFYDPATDRLYCISTGLSFLNHVVMAHEIAHALQDQYDDLEAFYAAVKEFDDRALARQAVVEGEAQYLTDRYMARHALAMAEDVDDDAGDVLRFSLGHSLAQAGAPPYFTALLTFPYVQGSHFVEAVVDERGMAAIDTLFADPPLSSEQVLHPEKFLDPELRDDPVPVEASDLMQALPDGWTHVYTNELGEFQTELFLRLAGDPVRALRASFGWDGDQYRVYEHAGSGRLLLQWDAYFDGEEDAAEAVDALRKVMERSYRWDPDIEAQITMDEEKHVADARSPDGELLATARREGDRVVYLDGIRGLEEALLGR